MPCNQETVLRSRNYLFSVPALAPPLSIIWWFQLKHKNFSSVFTHPVTKNVLSHPNRCGSKDLIVFFLFVCFLVTGLSKKMIWKKLEHIYPKSEGEKFHVSKRSVSSKKSIRFPKDRVWNRIQSWILLKLSKWGSAVWIPLIAD